jgi:UDP-glucose 4-epimerase
MAKASPMFDWKEKKVLVTGGAGFIGSSLCERLVTLGSSVVILDNLSSRKRENVEDLLKTHPGKAYLLEMDCTKPNQITKAVHDVDVLFHFAANPEVRLELNDPRNCFKQNVYATHVLLEALRQNGNIERIVFASTSTVYGDAEVLPTPESFGPLKPISVYGASKLASEALISSYAYTCGFSAVIFRLANVIGPRSNHGVIIDFINKLNRNKNELEILGDGSQRKSYIHVDDCIDAILAVCEKSSSKVDIFNVGSEDWITVSRIAEIVVEELGLKSVKFRFAGGVDGGRGWKGDVKRMFLDVSRLKALGWKSKYNSEEAVRKTIEYVIQARQR